MNADVLVHVVAMVNQRSTRAALGFSVDRCIQLKLPPCKLRPYHKFLEHLEFLMNLRVRFKPVCVYNVASKSKISVGFGQLYYVGYRVNRHYLETWFEVITNTSLNWRTRSDQWLRWQTHQGAEVRMYYMDMFTGECQREFDTYIHMDGCLSLENNPTLLIKPTHGRLHLRRT